MCPHSGYEQLTVYRCFFGLGIFNLHPHISHWTTSVSGSDGLGASSNTLPAFDCDHPRESV